MTDVLGAVAALIVPNSVAFLIGVATILIAVRFRAGRAAAIVVPDDET